VIERDDDGDVAVLRLAHGPVSAMDLELCRAVATAFRDLATEPARAVVLTGTGRSFSAGVDLRRYLDDGADYVRAFLPALDEMFRAAFTLSKPVVAAVNGHAIAGGCVLAAAADVRYAAAGGGRMGIPEIEVGVPFPRTPLEIVRYAVGDVVARRLALGARTHPMAEALTLGLVDEVLPPEELLPRALAEARRMADAVPADTFAVTKTQLRRDAVERMDRYTDEEAAVEELWTRRATDGWTARYLDSVTRR
jgi:enoyl-CoA hydratase